MLSPKWFEKELSYIDPEYFVVWDGKKYRWQIRRWLTKPTVWSRGDWDNIMKNSVLILIVKYNDDRGRDIGYHPLDQRVLYTLKKAKKFTERPAHKILKEIDDANAELVKKAEQEEEEIIKDAAKIGYNAMTRIWSK